MRRFCDRRFVFKCLCALFMGFLAVKICSKFLDPAQLMGRWALGDLLSNYQGGFVRRGLFGQGLFLLENPASGAFLLQKIGISAFLLGSIGLIFLWTTSAGAFFFTIMVSLSPGGLLDMASRYHYEYLQRKEIWFYVSLIAIIYSSRLFGFYSTITLVVALLLSVTMILHHELFAVFFAPVLVTLFFLKARNMSDRRAIVRAMLYALPLVVTFVSVFISSGSEEIKNAILKSYLGTDAEGIRAGIKAIGWSFEHSNSLSGQMFIRGSVLPWLFYMLLAMSFGVLFLTSVFRSAGQFVLGAGTLLWLVIAVLIAAFSGWDWGRWVSIFSIGCPLLFTLIMLVARDSLSGSRFEELTVDRSVAAPKYLKIKYVTLISFSVLFVVILAVLTRMNHCCPQQKNIHLTTDHLCRVISCSSEP